MSEHRPEIEKYPEHEKLQALAGERDTVQEFLDWMIDSSKYVICERDEETYTTVHFFYTNSGPEQIMAEFFGIDLKKLSKEKDEMYREIVRANEEREAAVRINKIAAGVIDA